MILLGDFYGPGKDYCAARTPARDGRRLLSQAQASQCPDTLPTGPSAGGWLRCHGRLRGGDRTATWAEARSSPSCSPAAASAWTGWCRRARMSVSSRPPRCDCGGGACWVPTRPQKTPKARGTPPPSLLLERAITDASADHIVLVGVIESPWCRAWCERHRMVWSRPPGRCCWGQRWTALPPELGGSS